MLDFCFETPASHLAQRKTAAKFIRRNVFFPLANIVSNVKSFADREFYAMKNGSIGGSFFGFAFGTSTRKGFFPETRVRISAFLTYKTIGPFYPSQKFKAFIITSDHLLKLFGTKTIAKYFAHDRFFLVQM